MTPNPWYALAMIVGSLLTYVYIRVWHRASCAYAERKEAERRWVVSVDNRLLRLERQPPKPMMTVSIYGWNVVDTVFFVCLVVLLSLAALAAIAAVRINWAVVL